MYNLLARGIEQEFLPLARHCGIITVAYNPLAGGLLTGKHANNTPAPGSRFEDNQVYRDRYWHPAYLRAVAELCQVAGGIGRTIVSLALNWLLHHTVTDCVVLGATRPEQLQQNLQAIDEGPLP